MRLAAEASSNTAPDLAVDLYDELVEKGKDTTENVAIRFVFTGTLTTAGATKPFETEVAAFLKLAKGELVEWRIVVDEGIAGYGQGIGVESVGLCSYEVCGRGCCRLPRGRRQSSTVRR